MQRSIFVLPRCCSVVFQAASCSRCSQSHMCFFAPSNDIFPMQTVASTAFAVFVKKHKSYTCTGFLYNPLSNGGGGPFLSSPSTCTGTEGRRFLPASTQASLPVPPTPTALCETSFCKLSPSLLFNCPLYHRRQEYF